MELSSSLTILSCLCLALITSPATAKCRGKWRIHACFGGNGKRSDPSLDTRAERPVASLLDTLLGREPFSTDILEDDPMAVSSYEGSFEPRSQYPDTRVKLQQLMDYLTELRVQQKLRQRASLV